MTSIVVKSKISVVFVVFMFAWTFLLASCVIVESYHQALAYHGHHGHHGHHPPPPPVSGCTTGWTITGYYIPYEGDFTTPTENISVTYGPYQGTFSFRSAFVTAIETEATGQTMLGWYLTTFDGGATFGSEYQPILQSTGLPPTGETVATDNSVIPIGTHLTIPSLYAPWNSYQFIAEDSGGGVTGKHIDIFTGVGAAAGNQTLHLSPVDDNTVCR